MLYFLGWVGCIQVLDFVLFCLKWTSMVFMPKTFLKKIILLKLGSINLHLKREFLEHSFYWKILKQFTIIQQGSLVPNGYNKTLLLHFHGRQSAFLLTILYRCLAEVYRFCHLYICYFVFITRLASTCPDDFCWIHDSLIHIFKWLLGQFPFSDFEQMETRKDGKRDYTGKGREGAKTRLWIPTYLPSCLRWRVREDSDPIT